MKTALFLETNQLAPVFVLPNLEGIKHALVDYRDRIIIVNFWSAECPWCERVDRELLSLITDWEMKVILLSIASNINERPELLRISAVARGLPLVLIDEGHQIADQYGAMTTPHFFVIDRGGLLRYQGAFDDVSFRKRVPQEPYLQNAIEALLGGKEPDPAFTPAYGCVLVRSNS